MVNGTAGAFNSNGNLGADVLSSLDRDDSGAISVSNIGVDAQNLSTDTGTTITAATADTASLDENGGTDDDVQIALGSAFLDTSGGATGMCTIRSARTVTATT